MNLQDLIARYLKPALEDTEVSESVDEGGEEVAYFTYPVAWRDVEFYVKLASHAGVKVAVKDRAGNYAGWKIWYGKNSDDLIVFLTEIVESTAHMFPGGDVYWEGLPDQRGTESVAAQREWLVTEMGIPANKLRLAYYRPSLPTSSRSATGERVFFAFVDVDGVTYRSTPIDPFFVVEGTDYGILVVKLLNASDREWFVGRLYILRDGIWHGISEDKPLKKETFKEMYAVLSERTAMAAQWRRNPIRFVDEYAAAGLNRLAYKYVGVAGVQVVFEWRGEI